MLKIFYNEKSKADIDIKLTIKSDYIKAEVEETETERKGADVIESLLPYNSYALVDHPWGVVKIYRQISRSDYQWLNLNRLGVAIRLDFSDIIQLHGTSSLIQVDTGATTEDMVIRLFVVNKDKLTIESDMEYELSTFNSDNLALDAHPRMTLWDSYSLTANGVEYKADCKGYFTDDTDVQPIPAAEAIDFTIKKYQGDFTDKLERDIDDEEVFVDCSVGCLDTRRVRLENGVGHFKLITFGYTGEVKIKLGRKWYEVWNDYSLTIQ